MMDPSGKGFAEETAASCEDCSYRVELAALVDSSEKLRRRNDDGTGVLQDYVRLRNEYTNATEPRHVWKETLNSITSVDLKLPIRGVECRG
jgi:hypothetical protein